MFYAASTGGFYDPNMPNLVIPPDAVGLTQAQYSALLQGQQNGKKIVAGDNGFPVWEEYQQEKTYAESRAEAYPDFRDYLDGIVKGDQAQVDAYIAACLAVKERFPKP